MRLVVWGTMVAGVTRFRLIGLTALLTCICAGTSMAQSSHLTITPLSDIARLEHNPAYFPKQRRIILGVNLGQDVRMKDKPLSSVGRLTWGHSGLLDLPDYERRGVALSFGRPTRWGFLSILGGYSSLGYAHLDAPLRDFARLPIGCLVGRSLVSEGVRLRQTDYLYASAGWSFDELLEYRRLRLGLRLRVMMGLRHFERDMGRFNLKASPKGDVVDANIDYEFLRAGFIYYGEREYRKLSIAEYYGQQTSVGLAYGLAAELGFEYDLSNQLTLSGTITDLGGIHWERALRGRTGADPKVEAKDKRFAQKPKAKDTPEGPKNISDILYQVDEVVGKNVQTQDAYSAGTNTWLAPRGHVALEYRPIKAFKLSGLVGASEYDYKHYAWEAALAATWQPSHYFGCNLAFFSHHHSRANVGLGLTGGLEQLLLSVSIAKGFSSGRLGDRYIQLGMQLNF